MWSTDYGTIATRLLIAFGISLALVGCVSGEDENQEAKKIAEKVKREAELSEKAEGRQDLVKDKVTVGKGEKVNRLSNRSEKPHLTAEVSTVRRLPPGEKFNQNDRTAAHPTLLWEHRQL